MAIVPGMAFEDRLLSVTDVAQEFHVTDQTVRNWIDRGVIPAIRAGHAFRIRRSAVEELFERAATSGGSLSGVRRDLWQPDYARLGRRGAAEERAIWDVIDDAARLMRHECLTIRQAMDAAIAKEGTGAVETAWSDAGVMPGDPAWAGGTVFVDHRPFKRCRQRGLAAVVRWRGPRPRSPRRACLR